MAITEDVFLTFGDGSFGWRGARKRLIAESRKTDFFKFSIGLDFKNVWNIDVEIGELIQHLLELSKRGFGYWAWKPSILLFADSVFPNQTIWYADAGSSFNFQSTLVDELAAWREYAIMNNGLAWYLPNHPEISWTKIELFNRLKVPKNLLKKNQIQSGLIILPPSDLRRKFLLEWREIMKMENGFYLTDEFRQQQPLELIEHRHDQSIFSILWRKYNFGQLPDKKDPYTGAINSPILSTRNNTQVSYFRNRFSINLISRFNLMLDKIMKYINLIFDYIFPKF